MIKAARMRILVPITHAIITVSHLRMSGNDDFICYKTTFVEKQIQVLCTEDDVQRHKNVCFDLIIR